MGEEAVLRMQLSPDRKQADMGNSFLMSVAEQLRVTAISSGKPAGTGVILLI